MKVNPVGNKYSEVDRAYLAGFLDADGAIMATIERHREKKFGFRVRIILKITQQNRKVLDWFCKHFQVGNVAKNRTTHDWLIKDQRDAKNILRIVYSFLKVKKPQARKALSILEIKIVQKRDLLKAAHSADSLSRLNIRSKNRRKNHVSMIQDYLSSND